MQSHHESLQKAVARDKILSKLRIQVKRVLAEGDCPKLQRNWTNCWKDKWMKCSQTYQIADKIEILNIQIRDTTKTS